jgi:hypothetical protein
MGKFENGIWVAVQFLVCSHNETELAKQLVEESGLTMKDCLKAQKESGFEDVTMLEFINSIFPVDGDKHCSQCKHYEICPNYTITVVCYRSESQRGKSLVNIMKRNRMVWIY